MSEDRSPSPRGRLVEVRLDETIGRGTPDVEHERDVAIFDLIEDNVFEPEGAPAGGRFRLRLGLAEKRLVFEIDAENGDHLATHVLSLTPLRRVMKDYFMICDSYDEAVRSATPQQIEAIDMGRRGIHNDGSATLMERLAGKIAVDLETARRFFTLICVLHWSAARPSGRAKDALDD